MIRFIITAILTGLLFGILGSLINGNPYATKLIEFQIDCSQSDK